MSRRWLARPLVATFCVGGLVVGSLLMVAARPVQAQGRAPEHVPGEYIVLFRQTVTRPAEAAGQMAREHGLGLGHVYSAAIKGFSAAIPEARLRAVESDPRVQSVERDLIVTLAAKPGGGSAQPPQSLPTGVDRIQGDASVTAKIDGLDGVDERVDVDVAILDTGIQTNHPDLNVVGGVNYATGKSFNDGHGHGTHVAGTVAALDNGIGVVGVAPGARLWAVRVLDNSGFGRLSGILAGIDWVTAHADTIEVANMSLGFSGSNVFLDEAIANSVAAGITYVVAAGNDNMDASGFSPASHPDVICVSALADSDGMGGGLGAATGYGGDDTIASFSNFGSVVAIAAPGVNIRSTYKGSNYATLSGTSMASPHVAGAAALYIAANASASPADVKAALLAAASPAASPDGYTGGSKDAIDEPVLNVGGM